MNNLRFYIGIILFLCFATEVPLYAQDLSYYRIDDEDGLPSNEVYQTIQDHFGHIWIACDAGLYRYDGIRFKEYSTINQNSRSISNLQLDKDGGLWCQNFTGQIFKLSGDSLITFFDASQESSQYPSYTIDKENRIWIATDISIHILDRDGSTIKKIKNDQIPFAINGWLAIRTDGTRVICIDKASSFYSIDIHSFKTTRIPVHKEIGTRHIFFKDEMGTIVFSEQNPERKYFVNRIIDNSLKTVRVIAPENGSATHYFYKTIGTNTFMGTSTGLYISRNGKPFKKHLVGMKVSDIQKDHEGNFWISTLQDGIVVIPNLDVEVFRTDNSLLSDRNVYHITSYGNELFVGTYSGELFSLSPDNGQLKILQKNKQAKFRAIRKILFYNGTTFIACGPFLASDRPELNELSSLNNIRDMAIMNDHLYFTTPDRTGVIDLRSTTPKVSIIREKGGKKILCDPKRNTVYLACTDGLFKYINGYVTELKWKGKSFFVSSIQVENDQLWIGTMNNGIYLAEFHEDGFEINQFSKTNGSNVRALQVTNSTLWVSTEYGLNRTDLKSGVNTLFNKHDGIEFLEINDLAILKGKVYLATIRGLVSFPANMKGSNSVAPSIRITEIRKGSVSIGVVKKVDLYPDDHGLTVHFIAASLRSRGSFYYEYKIDGFDEGWKKLPAASPFISITGLPTGKYTFFVRAVNEDGISSQTPSRFNLVVHAPFFVKWWFIALIALVAIGFVTLLFLLRIRFLKRQALIKNRLILSQLTALKAQMNPHFMYNTLSSIQDFIWQNDTKNSNYYLSKFSLLMRKILDASDSSKISLQEEIEILSLYLELEQLRFGSSFSFDLSVEKEVDADHIYIPAMIIQPFVENAIKHGLLHKTGEKKLKVHFSLKENELHCSIIDNGIGREKAEEIKKRQEANHRSFATKATQKRIELLSLYDDSLYSFTIIDLYNNGEPSGTQVELILPFRIS